MDGRSNRSNHSTPSIEPRSPAGVHTEVAGNFAVTVVVMSGMKVVQRVCLALAATLVVASCGSGTESTEAPGSGGDRNVALADDDGRPWPGFSPSFLYVAIDVRNDRAWIAGDIRNSTGLVTGGLALYQQPKYASLDPAFPRVSGSVQAINYHAPTGEIAIAGYFDAVGDRGGMVERQRFALLNRDGLRDTNLAVSGVITSIARIGTKIFIGGNSTQIDDLVSGIDYRGSVGFHRISSTTGRVEAQRPLAGIEAGDQITAMAPGRAIPPNPALMAVVVEDPTRPKRFSLRIHDLNTGALVKSLLEDQHFIDISSIEGGWAVVEAQADSGGPSIARLLDIESKNFVRSHAPPDELVLAVLGLGGRARVLSTEKVTRRLVLTDLDTRTFAVLRRTVLPATNSFTMANFPGFKMLWMDDDSTLLSNGVMYEATIDKYQPLRATSDMWNVSAAVSLGTRGLLLGGGFLTSLETNRSAILQVPENGSPSGVREVDPDALQSVQDMTTTPEGVVAAVNGNAVVLTGADPDAPPVRLASIVEDRSCVIRSVKLAAVGDSLFVAGCWSSIQVGRTTTSNRLIEIDLAGDSPVLKQAFDVGATHPHAVAATDDYVFAASNFPVPELMSLRRATGVMVGRRPMGRTPTDMVGVKMNGRPVVFLGGDTIGGAEAGAPLGSLKTLDVTDLNASALDFSQSGEFGRRIASLAVDSSDTREGGPRYLYIGGAYLGPENDRTSVTRLDLETGALDPLFKLRLEGLLTRIAVHEGKVWAVGGFDAATVAGRPYRVSGIVGYDAEAHTPILRAATPTATTVPPATVPPVVGPDSDGSDDPSAGEPIGPTPPPDLPDSGEPSVGTYSVDSGNGLKSEVQVLADGSMTVLPGAGVLRNGAPFIERLVPGSRTVKVSWFPAPGKPVYKVTTGKGKSKRTCTTTKTSCTVKNLDPWKPHSFVVEAVRGKKRTTSLRSPAIKPFVKVKKSSSTKVSSLAPQGAKGKARWTTTSPCTVKNAKLVAPKKAGRCTLTVVAGKSTRRVTVRIG